MTRENELEPLAGTTPPWWAVVLLVIAVMNLALTIYLMVFVVRVQLAFAEIARQLESMPFFGG